LFFLDNVSFDVDNKGRGVASSCNAAAVIKEFVTCADWAHIDISGVGLLSATNTIPYLTKDKMTGRPTRTIIEFLYQLACFRKDDKIF